MYINLILFQAFISWGIKLESYSKTSLLPEKTITNSKNVCSLEISNSLWQKNYNILFLLKDPSFNIYVTL
jgi:hypothetical protein